MKTMRRPVCPIHGMPMETRQYRGQQFQGLTFFACPYVDESGNECDWRVGRNRDGSPKGTPADNAIRTARIAAHAAFDKIWKSGHMTRSEAYRWLARELGLTSGECHIGQFDQGRCERVVRLCQDLHPMICCGVRQ